jgi:hypothetical protein
VFAIPQQLSEEIDKILVTDPAQLTEEEAADRLEAKHRLLKLNPATIYRDFGVIVLAWAAANDEDKQRAEAKRDALCKFAGYEAELLAKALRWSREDRHGDRRLDIAGSDVLAEYRLEDIVLNRRVNVPVSDLVKTHALPQVEITDRRARRYSLVPIKALRDRPAGWVGATLPPYGPNTYYSVRLDAPTGFMLTYKQNAEGRPIPHAILGVATYGPAEVMIYQLQGATGKVVDDEGEVVRTISSRGLAVLDWRGLLIGLAERVAHAAGARWIGIQGAVNNSAVVTEGDTEPGPHLSLGAATAAYDLTARAAGFTKGQDNNWHKPLNGFTGPDRRRPA